ncbi:MAG: hypothetical protein L3J14_07600, partial [Flavobacteriaceae bacterium]|nr:hypothetical protein [Flavobacteriaceae bacterium]
NVNNVNNVNNVDNMNEIMMNKPNKIITLDTFVKRKKVQPEPEYIPIKKEINLTKRRLLENLFAHNNKR